MKRPPHLLAVLTAVLAVIAFGTGTAIATTTGPRLTNDEYVLLGDSQAAASKALSHKEPNWQALRAACLLLGKSTPLLQDSRGSCLGELGESRAWLAISTQAQKCTQTTTTGLAAAAGSRYPLSELVCLNPAYRALTPAVARLAAADRALRQSGIERGFTGHCLITLVPTTRQLATETGYLEAAKRLTADLALYVKVRNGTARRSAISGKTLLDAAVAVTPARDRWLAAAVAYRLSVCPHA